MIPKVSVVVAAYNIEGYIEKCIESLKNQTLKEIEFIIVNDGSKDNTDNIILNSIEDDARFIFINQQNGGLSSARNTGIRYSKAEFIAFLDGDDYVEANTYAQFYEKAIGENAELVISGFKKIWINNESEKITEKEFYFNQNKIKKGILEGFCTKHDENFVVAWNKLFRKSIIKNNNIGFENKAFFEDVGFLLTYLPHVKKLGVVNQSLINYIQRNGSITNEKSFNPIIEQSYRNISNKINVMNIEKDLAGCLINRLTIYCINYSLERNKQEKYSEFKKELVFNRLTNLPFKHFIAILLIKINLYKLIFRRFK